MPDNKYPNAMNSPEQTLELIKKIRDELGPEAVSALLGGVEGASLGIAPKAGAGLIAGVKSLENDSSASDEYKNLIKDYESSKDKYLKDTKTEGAHQFGRLAGMMAPISASSGIAGPSLGAKIGTDMALGAAERGVDEGSLDEAMKGAKTWGTMGIGGAIGHLPGALAAEPAMEYLTDKEKKNLKEAALQKLSAQR